MSGRAKGLYLGLISGTSVDAIDAALVDLDGAPRLLHAFALPYPPQLRERVLALVHGGPDAAVPLDELGAIDVEIGRAFAHAARTLLLQGGFAAGDVRAIGSHGQTVRHRPRHGVPFTLQLGDPNVIAELSGIDTVADFRRRDLAAGGEGAPLVPAFHLAMLASAQESRAILNLGGIANLTLLPHGGDASGFDTGPANALLDGWIARDGTRTHDAGGELARSGRVDEVLLEELLREPYFARPAPKSTGREHFTPAWLAQFLGQRPGIAAADVQATLVELTARTIADALHKAQPDTARVIACGGGVHNGYLMQRIAAALAPLPLQTSDLYGLDPDYVEAMAFAWLARETIERRPGNLARVTGAAGPRVLGGVYAA